MKKVITLIICLVLSTLVIAGCSDSEETFEEANYTADAQVSAINLDVEDREIEVTLSDDDRIHMTYYESAKEYYVFTVSDDHVLTMTSASDKNWTDYIGTKPSAEYRKIVLQIPDGLLNDIALSTTNEDITLPALAVSEDITLSCNGGNITFDSLDVGNALSLTAKNGDISGKVVGSYDDFAIQTKIKKGDSNLPESKEDGEKSLIVSCNNGDIDIEFVGQ